MPQTSDDSLFAYSIVANSENYLAYFKRKEYFMFNIFSSRILFHLIYANLFALF